MGLAADFVVFNVLCLLPARRWPAPPFTALLVDEPTMAVVPQIFRVELELVEVRFVVAVRQHHHASARWGPYFPLIAGRTAKFGLVLAALVRAARGARELQGGHSSLVRVARIRSEFPYTFPKAAVQNGGGRKKGIVTVLAHPGRCSAEQTAPIIAAFVLQLFDSVGL